MIGEILLGRPRSDYICPKCGKQGSLGRNSTRNGDYRNSRMHKYLRVTHFDPITRKRTPSCYVNDIIKKNIIEDYKEHQFGDLLLSLFRMEERFRKTYERFERVAEKVKTYPLTPREDRKLSLIVRQYYLDILIPFEKIFYLYELKIYSLLYDFECSKEVDILLDEFITSFNKIESKQEENPKKIIKKSLRFLKSHPLEKVFGYLFNKYEKPIRDVKRKALSKKLSESAFGSSKYDNTSLIGY